VGSKSQKGALKGNNYLDSTTYFRYIGVSGERYEPA